MSAKRGSSKDGDRCAAQLVKEESIAVRTSQRAVSMLATAISSLREPDDETAFARLYLLDAQRSWAVFHRAMRKEISRAGRWVAPGTHEREFREFREWIESETKKGTS